MTSRARHDTGPSGVAAPTSQQMRYLRALAMRTGRSFVMPQTRREASAEITRLKGPQPKKVPREQRPQRPFRRRPVPVQAPAVGAAPAEPAPTAAQVHDLKVLAARVGETPPACRTRGEAAAALHNYRHAPKQARKT